MSIFVSHLIGMDRHLSSWCPVLPSIPPCVTRADDLLVGDTADAVRYASTNWRRRHHLEPVNNLTAQLCCATAGFRGRHCQRE